MARCLLTEPAKSSVGKRSIDKKARKIPTCSVCKLVGHAAIICKIPVQRKWRAVELVDFDIYGLNFTDANRLKALKRRKVFLDLLELDAWV